MKKAFKKIVRVIHLWLGLGSGLVVFIVSITGCLYVFEEEIRSATQYENLYVAPQSKPFIGLEKILINFEHIAAGEMIRLIRTHEGRTNATVQISVEKDKVYYFNPYDGSLINKSAPDWLDTVEEIHISLLLGEWGKFLQRWSVVVFVLLLITGLILWLPRNLRMLKQALTIKKRASVKRINFDLHNVLGFYASSILIIIALSGLFFAFKGVKAAVAFVVGAQLNDGEKLITASPVLAGSMSSRYASIYRNAMIEYPGATATSLSVRKNGELRLRLIYPYKWARNQNTFYFNEPTGKLLRAKLYREFNRSDFIAATNYDLHTGKLFGLFGKIIAFMASFIAATLPVTGLIIWLKKKKRTI